MTRKSRVCFYMSGLDQKNEWYTFRLSAGGKVATACCNCDCPCSKRIRFNTQGSPFLAPTTIVNDEVQNPGWAVLGNRLYRLGGSFGRNRDPCKSVRSLDITASTGSVSRRWKRRSRMLSPRDLETETVVLRGKLYVFGGGVSGRNPWAEVYDPVLDSWEALPPPPRIPESNHSLYSGGVEGVKTAPPPGSSTLSAAAASTDTTKDYIVLFDMTRKSILDYSLLMYDVASKSWKLSQLPYENVAYFLGNCTERRAVAVGRKLFWFASEICRLYGYDVDTHVHYISDIVVDIHKHCSFGQSLGHLGGDGYRFFILYENCDDYYDIVTRHPADSSPPPSQSSSYSSGESSSRLVNCLQFSAIFTVGTRRMTISLESSQSFVIKVEGLLSGCTSV